MSAKYTKEQTLNRYLTLIKISFLIKSIDYSRRQRIIKSWNSNVDCFSRFFTERNVYLHLFIISRWNQQYVIVTILALRLFIHMIFIKFCVFSKYAMHDKCMIKSRYIAFIIVFEKDRGKGGECSKVSHKNR